MDGVPVKRDSWSNAKHKGMAQKCAIFFLEKYLDVLRLNT